VVQGCKVFYRAITDLTGEITGEIGTDTFDVETKSADWPEQLVEALADDDEEEDSDADDEGD